jgi:hypothetical protein
MILTKMDSLSAVYFLLDTISFTLRSCVFPYCSITWVIDYILTKFYRGWTRLT